MAVLEFEIECPAIDTWLFDLASGPGLSDRLLSLDGCVIVSRGKRRQVRLQTAVFLFLVEWLAWVREMLGGSREACHFFGHEESWTVRRRRRHAEIHWAEGGSQTGVVKQRLNVPLIRLAEHSVEGSLSFLRRALDINDHLEDAAPVQELLRGLRETQTAITGYKAESAVFPVRLFRELRRRGVKGSWVAVGTLAVVVLLQAGLLAGLWRQVGALRQGADAPSPASAATVTKLNAAKTALPELPPPAEIPGGQPAQPPPAAALPSAEPASDTGISPAPAPVPLPFVNSESGTSSPDFGAPPRSADPPRPKPPPPNRPVKLTGVIETEGAAVAVLERGTVTEYLRAGDVLTFTDPPAANWRVVTIKSGSVAFSRVERVNQPSEPIPVVTVPLGESVNLAVEEK